MYTFFIAPLDVSVAIINVFSCNTLQVPRGVFYCLFFAGVDGSQMGVACCCFECEFWTG